MILAQNESLRKSDNFLTYAKFSFTDRTVKSINEKALRSFRSSDFGEEKRTVNLESERTFCHFIRFDLSNRLIS